MRALAILLLVAPLVAGCLSNGAGPAPPPSNATNASTNGTAALPKVVFNQTHSFATGDAPTANNTGSASIPAGYAKLNLSVTFSPASPAPAPVPVRPPAGAASGVSVALGSLSCDLPDGPITAPVTCVKQGPATPGDAKIAFSGEGNVRARVVVTVS